MKIDKSIHYIDEALGALHNLFNKRNIPVIERLGIIEFFKQQLINETIEKSKKRASNEKE